ncbi:hypothetical protein [Paenisporosarcina antarctica]|uniref:hypothetical protein n=1 Tax=Paenisporosarcina antarctica TaxID=417367 RepID=UPI001416FD85|nr:hypothetical protein [Paenisporosarcina antarctica]
MIGATLVLIGATSALIGATLCPIGTTNQLSPNYRNSRGIMTTEKLQGDISFDFE